MDHIHSQEETKNIILSIEKKYPVDKWMVNGIHVWPQIRIKLYFALLTSSNKTSNHLKINTIDKVKATTKFLKLFKLIMALFNLIFFYAKLNKKPIVFFGAHFHRVLHKGQYFNRFYDSIIDYHGLHDRVYIVEYLKVYTNSFNKKAIISLSKQLDNYKLLGKFKKHKNIDQSRIFLEKYDVFFSDIEDLKIDTKAIGITQTDLINWSKKMKALQRFFTRFYKKVKPNKIVFLGYYGYDDLYAALITANKMNIETIDFQHGPQTNIHMAYTSWLKVPENGFNTMPKTFWNWDENSKQNIANWASKINNVNVKVIGQPYVSYSQIHMKKSNLSEKIILYSLQTSPLELLTSKMAELIIKSKHNWVLRLHPRNSTKISEINNFLKKNNIHKEVVIEKSQEVSLPETLTKTILHITNYSGCTIEATMMGVPTVLIHQVGKEMFNDYIDDNMVYYINQENLDFIEKMEFNIIFSHHLFMNIIRISSPGKVMYIRGQKMPF